MSVFAAPWALLLLLLLPPLWWLLGRARRLRRAGLARFAAPGLIARTSPLPPAASRLAQGLAVAGLACAIVALARPQIGRHPAPFVTTGRDLVVALDLSRSMKTADVGDTRLRRAKELAWQLAAARPGDRIGLVIFGGAAFLQLPPTGDLGTYQLFLDAADPDDVADPATDIAAALRVAYRALKREGTSPGSRAILLLSDGERTEGRIPEILDSLRIARLPVFAVGIGTLEGGRVPADSGSPAGPWHLDNIGRPVVSRLDEEDLKRIGETTTGGYARWDDPAALGRMAGWIAGLEARALASQPATEPNERFQWPLGLGLALLALGGVARRRRGRPTASGAPADRPVGGPAAVSPAALVVLALLSCTAQRDAITGRRLYEQGKWAEADQAFERATAKAPSPEARYNSGNTRYRLRRYDDAQKQWRDALGGPDPLRQRTYFNLGNALVRLAEDGLSDDYLRRAIASYEEALRLDPNDRDAKWNLELALRRRGDPDGSGSRGRGGRAQYGRGNMREDGYEAGRETAVGAMAGGGSGGDEGESVEELDPQQARALLEALERQQMSTHEGRPVRQGATGDHDW